MGARALRGRSAELRKAATVLARTVRTGQGAILLLVGEAGIGKTALAERIVTEAGRRGYHAGTGKAEESDQIAPGAPLLVALRSASKPLLADDVFLALAPFAEQPLWLVDRIADALERHALEAPLIVFVDDIQWADPLTVFALRVLPGRLAGSPIVWLLSARLEPFGPVEEILAAAGEETATERIDLQPLAADAIAQLAVDALGAPADPDVERLLAGAAGNPFLAIELLDGPAGRDSSSLPPTLVLRVRARLRRLPQATLRLLQTGAVLGRAFRVADAAALLGGPAEDTVLPAITPAVRDGIIDDDGEWLNFRHDLLRQAVYADIPASLRRVAHRDAAARMLAARASAIEAAPHVLASAEPGDLAAVQVLSDAAHSGGGLLPGSAADLIERAFALLRPADEPWSGVGRDAISLLADAGRTLQAVTTADALLAEPLPGDEIADVQDRVARPLWENGRLAAIRHRAETALTVPGLAPESRARLLGQRALALSRDEPDVAQAAGETALAEAESAGDGTALVTARRALGETARNNGRNIDALTHFRALRGLAGVTYLPDEILSLQLLDRYEEAATLLGELQARSQEGSTATEVCAYHFVRMWQGFNLGRLDDAEADALTVLHLGDQLKRLTYQNEARVILARILQLRGDYQASAAQLRQADAPVGASAGTDDEGRALIQSFMGVHLASALGDIDGALHTVRAMLDPASFSRHRWLWQPVWFLDVTHVAVVGGDHGLARRTAETADHLARLTPGVPSNLGVATLTRGLAQDDLSALAAGAEILRNSPRPLLAGTGALELGRALLAQDQRERGVAALEKAGRIFAAMGANGPARIVREALQGSGVRRRRWNNGNQPRPVRGWDALTPTEQRVARLIAAGHTNRSAAAQLVLSPNTIATHVRSIFRKLGVKSRVQLSLAVRDHQ